MADGFDLQTTEEGRQYEKEIMMVLQGEKRDYPSYFGGLKIASGHEFKITSPIDDSIDFGIFQEPEEGIMGEAVTAASKALKDWSSKTPVERASYFEPLLASLKARRMHFAAEVTVSSGMVREDALAEVDTAIEVVEKAIADAQTLGKRKAVGVYAVITAQNSPFASPIGFAVAAMISGNVVIMNPSKFCPMPCYSFYTLMERFNLPDGVLNLVVDRKDSATEELANDMRVKGIVASGSGDRLEDLMFMMVDDEVKFTNEIKGMNPAIVYRPSDMKITVRNIIDSAFSYTGQRPFSCSKVIVMRDDEQKFTALMSEYMKDLKVDDPVNDTTFTGPMVDPKMADKYADMYFELMPFILAKAAPVSKDLPDNYVSPIMVSGLDMENELNYMDSGMPILNMVVVDTLDEAFEELDNTECGLSAGLFTKDVKVMERFKNEVDVPQKYINASSRSLKPATEAVLTNMVR